METVAVTPIANAALANPRNVEIATANVVSSGTYLITPEVAKQMLANRNFSNRPIRQTDVDKYAREMKTGKWLHNGMPIVFAKITQESRLLQGQHRLLACIQANTAFVTEITCGIDEATFTTFDNSGRRSGGDQLAIAGFTPTKNAKQFGDIEASALKLLYAIDFHGNTQSAGRKAVTHNELIIIHDLYPGIEQSTRWIISKGVFRSVLTPMVAVVAHYLGSYRAKRRQETEDFLLCIKNVVLKQGTPAHLLYNKLVRIKDDQGQSRGRDIAPLTLKALRLTLDGRTVGRLTFNPDEEELPTFGNA